MTVTLTADRAPDPAAERQGRDARRKARPSRGRVLRATRAIARAACPASPTSSPSPRAKAASANRRSRSIFALALKEQGLRVGILDADIYGPSMPRLLGLKGQPQQVGDKLAPMEAYGLKAMSMGFLVDEETPMIWRGPMVMSALSQMLKDVAWGELDVLVVDMPPGTGDAQLTMAQQVPLAGAVIVSTPQDLALIDARKGLNMFRKVNVPVLGLVENMSTFVCPHCGERSDIFGHGGAQKRSRAARRALPRRGAAHNCHSRNIRQGTPGGTFRSSPTVVTDTPISGSASTRILLGKPPRAMWSAGMLLGLYCIRVSLTARSGSFVRLRSQRPYRKAE